MGAKRRLDRRLAGGKIQIPLLAASQSMEMNERTAKQPQRELGEVHQDVVVPERFGNRYRFSSQVFWSASFWKFRPEDFR